MANLRVKLMRKIILLFGLLLLIACQKEDVYCWKCETTSGGEVIYTDTLCGWTEDEIFIFEKTTEYRENTKAGIKNNGIPVKCSCIKIR